MLVLDTSALSAVMHRRPEAIERVTDFGPGEIVLAAPVAAEIHYGLERLAPGSRRRQLLRTEYARLRLLLRWHDWTEEAAVLFGRHKASLAARGELIDDMDIAIGTLALTLDASLATYNVRHFERLAGLDVHDWSAPPRA